MHNLYNNSLGTQERSLHLNEPSFLRNPRTHTCPSLHAQATQESLGRALSLLSACDFQLAPRLWVGEVALKLFVS